MTDENLEELPELVPLDEDQASPSLDPASAGADPATAASVSPSTPLPGAPGATAVSPVGAPRGAVPVLPAPAFNPGVDKEYYRFLFAGVIMLLGCMMPFGPEWEMAGYKTLGGAFCTLVSLGMVWTWWGAIGSARFGGQNLKWVGLALVVFILQLMNLLRA